MGQPGQVGRRIGAWLMTGGGWGSTRLRIGVCDSRFGGSVTYLVVGTRRDAAAAERPHHRPAGQQFGADQVKIGHTAQRWIMGAVASLNCPSHHAD